MKWEIKKDGVTVCHGESEATYPNNETLKSLAAAGYKIYLDGKLQKVRLRG